MLLKGYGRNLCRRRYLQFPNWNQYIRQECPVNLQQLFINSQQQISAQATVSAFEQSCLSFEYYQRLSKWLYIRSAQKYQGYFDWKAVASYNKTSIGKNRRNATPDEQYELNIVGKRIDRASSSRFGPCVQPTSIFVTCHCMSSCYCRNDTQTFKRGGSLLASTTGAGRDKVVHHKMVTHLNDHIGRGEVGWWNNKNVEEHRAAMLHAHTKIVKVELHQQPQLLIPGWTRWTSLRRNSQSLCPWWKVNFVHFFFTFFWIQQMLCCAPLHHFYFSFSFPWEQASWPALNRLISCCDAHSLSGVGLRSISHSLPGLLLLLSLLRGLDAATVITPLVKSDDIVVLANWRDLRYAPYLILTNLAGILLATMSLVVTRTVLFLCSLSWGLCNSQSESLSPHSTTTSSSFPFLARSSADASSFFSLASKIKKTGTQLWRLALVLPLGLYLVVTLASLTPNQRS